MCSSASLPSERSEPSQLLIHISFLLASLPLLPSARISLFSRPPLPPLTYVVNHEQRSAGSREYYLKNFHSSSRLLVSPSICCPEPKGNMGFTKRARATENAITAYPSRFPSFSLVIQGNAGMARTCSSLGLLYFSHSFSSPLFLLPLRSLLFHFFPLTCLVSSYRPLLSPLLRLSSSAVSISLPRAQRQFSRSSPEPFSSPFFIPFYSLFRLSPSLSPRLILVFTNSSGVSGQYDQISAG